jgi:hypothetical protein
MLDAEVDRTQIDVQLGNPDDVDAAVSVYERSNLASVLYSDARCTHTRRYYERGAVRHLALLIEAQYPEMHRPREVMEAHSEEHRQQTLTKPDGFGLKRPKTERTWWRFRTRDQMS